MIERAKNIAKKTINESIAEIEQSIFKAESDGNTKLLRALKLTLRALKNKKIKDKIK
jgi:hypothetical protein